MRCWVRVTAAIAGGIVCAATAFAQNSSVSAVTPAPLRVELRMGSAVPPDKGSEGGAAILGVLVAVPLRATSSWQRVGIQFAIDYAELGRTVFTDPTFGRAASTDNLFLLTPRLGVTAVRTPRLVADMHIGGGLVIRRATFALESTPDANVVLGQGLYSGSGGDEFENVCDLSAFAQRCRNRYDGVFTLGAGFRFLRKPGGSLFFGADYGWFSNHRHQVVGTVGVMRH